MLNITSVTGVIIILEKKIRQREASATRLAALPGSPAYKFMKLFPITENHLFQKAYRGGSRAVSKSVSVYVLRDRRAGLIKKRNPMGTYLNRIGISASKKIGGAVQRNRAKRVVREAYRQIDRKNDIKTGYLIVIALREPATVLKMQDVMRDLQYCLKKIGMIK